MVKKVTKKSLKNEIPETDSVESIQNKQLIVFFVVMLTVVGSFLMVYFYNYQQNNFSYAGIDFQKGKTGDVEYYYGQVQMPRINEEDNRLIFNLYLRLNPKKNDVPINTEDFALSQKVVIAFEPESQGECLDKLMLAQGNLEQFFNAFPWVEAVSGAYTDEEYAKEKGLAFANCNSSRSDRTIVMFNKTNSNSIEKQGNCYILNIKDCSYLESSERLIMGFVGKINRVEL